MPRTFARLGALAVVLVAATVAVAEGHASATQTLAEITMNLNHFPTDEDKAALGAIVESDESSEEEASIAMALSNMQHQVTEADAERLTDIVDDDLSDAAARELARILLGINHSPTDADKAALASLAGD